MTPTRMPFAFSRGSNFSIKTVLPDFDLPTTEITLWAFVPRLSGYQSADWAVGLAEVVEEPDSAGLDRVVEV